MLVRFLDFLLRSLTALRNWFNKHSRSAHLDGLGAAGALRKQLVDLGIAMPPIEWLGNPTDEDSFIASIANTPEISAEVREILVGSKGSTEKSLIDLASPAILRDGCDYLAKLTGCEWEQQLSEFHSSYRYGNKFGPKGALLIINGVLKARL